MKRRYRFLLYAALFAAGGMLSGYRSGMPLRATLALAHSQKRAAPALSSDAALARLASADPDMESRFGRLASALHEPDGLKRNHDLHEALRELNAAELPGFIERARRLPQRFREPLLAALAERWFELDAQSAAAWVRTQPDRWMFCAAWARHAPESALAEAHAYPGTQWSRELMKSAIATIAGTDAKARAAALAALPSDPCRDRVLVDVAGEWAKADPAACLAFARALPPCAARSEAMDVAVKAWAALDPLAAMPQLAAILPELAGGLRDTPALSAVAEAVARKDVSTVLRWAAGLPEAQRNAATAIAARVWARQDPVAALRWCQENGIDTARDVVHSAMGKDAAKTLHWIETLPPDAARDRLLEHALGARSAFTSPPVSAEKAAQVTALVVQLPTDAQERVAYQLGWASGDQHKLEDVRVWSQQFNDPRLRMAAVEAAVKYRYGANPANEEKILQTFSQGVERDAALRGIALMQRDAQPTQAALKALQITDDQTRREVLDDVIAGWLSREPQKARAWLEANPSIPREWVANWTQTSP